LTENRCLIHTGDLQETGAVKCTVTILASQ
jgi:hypothetical protein